MDGQHPPVVVHPLEHGARWVTIRGHDVGRAHRLTDVVEFLRSAELDDLDLEGLDLGDPALVEWWGGGPELWPA
jgi:hypothetical protein